MARAPDPDPEKKSQSESKNANLEGGKGCVARKASGTFWVSLGAELRVLV